MTAGIATTSRPPDPGDTAAAEGIAARAQPRFLGIQMLRGVSVIFTVLAHLPTATAPFAAYKLPAPWMIGVAIFYGISGWIIAHVTRNHTGNDIAGFLTRRLFRIFPILLVTAALTIGFGIVLPHSPMVDQFYPDTAIALRAAFANLLFISDVGIMLSVPAPNSLLGLWSIAVEVKFYIVYALLLVIAPWFRSIALFVLLAVILYMRWRMVLHGNPVGTSHVFFLELFCVGGISYRFYRYFRHSWILSILAWTWVFVFAVSELHGIRFMLGYIGLLASIVYIVNHAAVAAIRADGGWFQRALIWVGERSYVLYVMHFQILSVAGLSAQLMGVNYTSPLLYEWILNISILVGLPVVELLHQTVEKGGIRVGACVAGRIRHDGDH